MDSRSVAYLLIGAGLAAVVAGLLVLGGALRWFGHLPGDLHYSSDNVRVYFPITSMLVVSVLLSVALAIVRRIW